MFLDKGASYFERKKSEIDVFIPANRQFIGAGTIAIIRA